MKNYYNDSSLFIKDKILAKERLNKRKDNPKSIKHIINSMLNKKYSYSFIDVDGVKHTKYYMINRIKKNNELIVGDNVIYQITIYYTDGFIGDFPEVIEEKGRIVIYHGYNYINRIMY